MQTPKIKKMQHEEKNGFAHIGIKGWKINKIFR